LRSPKRLAEQLYRAILIASLAGMALQTMAPHGMDRRVLYVLTFNYPHLDMEHSRSFGLVIDEPAHVEEAVRLF